MERKMIRKKEKAMLGGVCAGLGEYLGIDPLWIRLFFVIWTVSGGSAILVYFILWLVIPVEGDTAPVDFSARVKQVGDDISEVARHPNPQLITFAGVGLIGMGAVFLLREFGFPWLSWFNWELIWPAMLVLAGVVLLIRAFTRKS